MALLTKVPSKAKIENLDLLVHEKQSVRDWLINTLFFSMIILLLANGWLWLTQPFAKEEPNKLPAVHTWIWWATQEYLSYSPAPGVVLAGSSLFMHSVSRQDADFLNQDFDYVHHHYSVYLAKQLEQRFHLQQSPVCFNFALPGDLVSDDYMVMRALFKGNHKPKYLILGLSLRDFVDVVAHCPGTTPPFRYLSRFTNIDDIANIAFPLFWQRFDYYISRIFYPWAKRLDIQAWGAEQTKSMFVSWADKFCAPSLLNNLDYRKHVPANLHSEVEEGMAIVNAHIPYSYDSNFADYKRRYGIGTKYKWMFNIQKQFFIKLIALAKQENIKLVILNMPLTDDNMKLMLSGSYKEYLDLLKSEALRNNFPFLDLNDNSTFVKTDFYDTAHMNSSGGKKLLDIIANTKFINL